MTSTSSSVVLLLTNRARLPLRRADEVDLEGPGTDTLASRDVPALVEYEVDCLILQQEQKILKG